MSQKLVKEASDYYLESTYLFCRTWFYVWRWRAENVRDVWYLFARESGFHERRVSCVDL